MTTSSIPMITPEPLLEAVHADGDVLIVTDPATARRLAQAWALLNKDETGLGVTWGHEVVDVMRAAAMADAQRRTTIPPIAVVRTLRIPQAEAAR